MGLESLFQDLHLEMLDEEEMDYPQTIDEIVDGLPFGGSWVNKSSASNFRAVGSTLLKDYGLDFEEVKDILEMMYIASMHEFRDRQAS